jgi:hypothetical protein
MKCGNLPKIRGRNFTEKNLDKAYTIIKRLTVYAVDLRRYYPHDAFSSELSREEVSFPTFYTQQKTNSLCDVGRCGSGWTGFQDQVILVFAENKIRHGIHRYYQLIKLYTFTATA